jgi:amidase
MDDLLDYDGLGLGELTRKGEITPRELLEVVIRRVEGVNPKLNAVVLKFYDQGRKAADGLAAGTREETQSMSFYGVPYLIKDMFTECEGTPFSDGSRAVHGYVSKVDAEIVKRMKAGGVTIAGRTNAPEFGLVPCTEPILFGPTLNPWNPSLTPGGSSGGSAAAVAAGIVPMAGGNDGGGSIRVPASCCGVFGLKPTRARNPVGPLFGDLIGGAATEHALTRTVRDSAALLDLTSGPELGDPYFAPPKERPYLEETEREPKRLKIGLLVRLPLGWHDEPKIDPECERAARDAASLCEDLGHIVEEVNPQSLSHADLGKSFGTVFNAFAGHVVAYWERVLGKKITADQVEPLTWATYQSSLRKTCGDYLVVVEDVQRFSRKVAHWYSDNGFDVLMSPTMPLLPPPMGSFMPGGQVTPSSRRCRCLSSGPKKRPRSGSNSPAASVTKPPSSDWLPNWREQDPGAPGNLRFTAAR